MLLLIDKILYFLSILVSTTLSINFHVINDTEVLPGTFPFMVSVRYNYNHICGGTIINRKSILTAANCVYKKGLSKLKVRLTNGSKLHIKSIKCHENYKKIGGYDIAILQTLIEFPEDFQFVKLASSNFSTKVDSSGILVSWGRTEYNTFSGNLQLTTVVIYNDLTCSSSYNMLKNMCVGALQNFSGSCKGDSGGPLLVNGSQVGIISSGTSESCTGFNKAQPKILTRVSKYLDWIQKNNADGFRDFFIFKAVAFCVTLRFFN